MYNYTYCMTTTHGSAAVVTAEDAAHLNAAVRRLAIAHRARTSALLGQCGVSIGQELLLLELADREPCTQAELAAAANCEASTITVAVRKLEAGGHIRRSPSATDARAVAVHLTPKGRAVIRALRDAQTSVAAELLSGLPPGVDGIAFVALLEAATKGLEPSHAA